MKRKLTTYFALLLTALLLAGCSADTTPGTESSTPETSGQESTESQTQGSGAQGSETQGSQSQSSGPQDSGTQSSESQGAGSHVTGTGNSGSESSVTGPVSEEEAKKIALKHAGLTENDVTFVKSGIDTEHGKKYYDIEFYTADGKEYDYNIEAATGTIADYDLDAEYYPQTSDDTEGAKISAEEAKKIALEKVSGATEKDIREFHLDYDDGKYLYEGKIYYNQTEYEFEIDGSDGKILDWDEEPIQ